MDIACCFYYSENHERQIELETTLLKNMENKFINEIHLFITACDKKKIMNSTFKSHMHFEKLHFYIKEDQPTYEYLLNFVSKLEDRIVAICNSDIEFIIDKSCYYVFDKLKNNNLAYFLSRHEYDMSSPQIDRYGGSHDAFIFHSTILKNRINNRDLSYLDYVQNTSGIEALLTIFFIETLEYKLQNPCYQIVLKHHHKSNVRLWLKPDITPIGYIHPHPRNAPGVHCCYMIYPCKI